MIFTDGVHLVSNKDVIELRKFGKRIGLKPEWLQVKKIVHYDLTSKRKFEEAKRAGAVVVTTRELIKEARKAKGSYHLMVWGKCRSCKKDAYVDEGSKQCLSCLEKAESQFVLFEANP